jgi:type IV secretory pathway protease TraF
MGMSAGAFLLLVAIASALSGCPLTVNVNVSTDKPIPVYLIVDKPVPVKLDGDLAITKVPPLHADAEVGVSKLPPIRLGL